MFVTHGPVQAKDPLLMPRKSCRAAFESWIRDVSSYGAIVGGRQTGKTTFLLDSRASAAPGTLSAFVDLRAFSGASWDACVGFLSEELSRQLGPAFRDGAPPYPRAGELA